VVDITDLPSINAFLNATSATLLIAGYFFIRQRNTPAHQQCMVAAFVVSILFLISYLIYHYHAGTTRFAGPDWVRRVYLSILFSHTVLAALVPFLAVVTLFRAWKERFKKHRAIARWTFPIWLYVSVTGVVIYVMLYHLYPPPAMSLAIH
jgi:putative membrane protein